ncbi:toxin YdaT family protein [Enterobacter hormaechei]|uniref:toxin YdaT family protein n=1 Tax=Enterobacter hormaechei TaxID=158836 RepID=UPI001F0D7D85|nr:toxin YdaT family protein [Enterobacter hormaechei]
MHSLAYQQGNKFSPTAMIYQNRREPDSAALNIDGIRAAVRAWAADCRSREFVAALIVEEWRAIGGTGLDIPTDSHRQMQKVFRWIDGDTEYAANNIRQLAPAMSITPLKACGGWHSKLFLNMVGYSQTPSRTVLISLCLIRLCGMKKPVNTFVGMARCLSMLIQVQPHFLQVASGSAHG